MDVSMRIDVAGLGIGAFGGALNLLHATSKVIQAWRDLRDIERDLELLRAKILLQQDLLEQWQRDWYGFAITGKSSIQRLRLLKGHDQTIQTTLKTAKNLIESLEPLRKVVTGESELTIEARVHWVASQKESSLNTIAEVESLLASLYKLLPPRIPNVEAAQLVLAFPEGGAAPRTQSSLFELALQAMPDSVVVNRTVGLRRLEGSLRDDLERRVKEFQSRLPAPNLESHAARVRVERDDEWTAGSRSFGCLDNRQPVIIEWKKYDSSWQGQKGIRLRGRIDNLARMLHADQKPEELLTLRCLEYFDRPKESRYGFVFAYPQGCDAKACSLKQLLDNPSIEMLPSLESRYQIAYSLGLSLAILHTAEWLHKSIRSQNILFATQQDHVLWSRPYLAGFEYSRPDQPDESSEKVEQSVRFNLYRHPSSQGSPIESFRKAFDVYSLGVVLLEIGMWRSAWKWWKDGLNALEFRNVMITLASGKLAHFMGEEYRDATLKCLNGELETRSGPISKAFFIEVVEVLGKSLI